MGYFIEVAGPTQGVKRGLSPTDEVLMTDQQARDQVAAGHMLGLMRVLAVPERGTRWDSEEWLLERG
jgi:hypothetical protein